jgi:hypothetical protein
MPLKDAANLAKATLKVGQGAYVTIGRKDGVVAEMVVPKDKSKDAEIVLYFQNSGHVPAQFAWGTQLNFLTQGSKQKSSGIRYVDPYIGFPAKYRDKKTGEIHSDKGESFTISGDSIFAATLGPSHRKIWRRYLPTIQAFSCWGRLSTAMSWELNLPDKSVWVIVVMLPPATSVFTCRWKKNRPLYPFHQLQT